MNMEVQLINENLLAGRCMMEKWHTIGVKEESTIFEAKDGKYEKK